jgi:putative addiction module killer protein
MKAEAEFRFGESEEFKAWLASLKDSRTRGKIENRLNMARAGNLGKIGSVGSGVLEMKLDFGPGYRVYFFQLAIGTYWALCGGDKDSQVDDVKYEPIAKRQFCNSNGVGRLHRACGAAPDGIRSEAGRVFGASCMLRHSIDALGARLAAPDAASGVEGADVSPSFARGSYAKALKIAKEQEHEG